MRQSTDLIRLLERQKSMQKLYAASGASPVRLLAEAGLAPPLLTCYPTQRLRNRIDTTNIISDDVEIFARSIQEDFENEDVLYLGTEFGLYITINGGQRWSKFENNMPAVAVHHLEMQIRTPEQLGCVDVGTAQKYNPNSI